MLHEKAISGRVGDPRFSARAKRRFFLQRLLDLCLIVFGVSLIIFFMIRLIPGDAITIMLGTEAVTPEQMAELRTRLGLDQPFLTQYWRWLSAAMTGDLGTSLWTGRPVSEEITASVWPTLELTLLAFSIGAACSLPLGCLMAVTRGRVADVALRIGAVVGLTIPTFWLGTLLLIVASRLVPRFHSLGYVPFGVNPMANLERMALPASLLALPILASLSRLVRSSMLDALGQDYVRTARAKGVPERRVVFSHALRNALIPFVTGAGIQIGYLLSGAVVVEQVFAISGLGRLIVGAIAERNYPVIQATLLVVTVAFVGVNFLADLLCSWIDPRIRA